DGDEVGAPAALFFEDLAGRDPADDVGTDDEPAARERLHDPLGLDSGRVLRFRLQAGNLGDSGIRPGDGEVGLDGPVHEEAAGVRPRGRQDGLENAGDVVEPVLGPCGKENVELGCGGIVHGGASRLDPPPARAPGHDSDALDSRDESWRTTASSARSSREGARLTASARTSGRWRSWTSFRGPRDTR